MDFAHISHNDFLHSNNHDPIKRILGNDELARVHPKAMLRLLHKFVEICDRVEADNSIDVKSHVNSIRDFIKVRILEVGQLRQSENSIYNIS